MRRVVLVLALIVFVSACADDGASSAIASTTSTTAPAATTVAAPTTIDDGPDATPVDDVCAILDGSLRDAGLIVDGAPEQQLTPTATGCTWGLLTLDVASDVDSSAFEEVVASLPGDPMTVDGLGELAVSSDSQVVAYEGGHLVTVSGHEVMGEEQLESLTRVVLARL